MHMSRRQYLALMGSTLATGALARAAPARAASYPSGLINLVVPAAPGGALDIMSRLLASKASGIIGQTMIVENKPGANWDLGMDYVGRADPDGYTLIFLASSGVTVNPWVFPNIKRDPLASLTGVIAVTRTPYVLLVNKDLPARDISSFIELLKKSGGKMNHASNSAGSMLVSQLFRARTGTTYTDVNYRGAGPAMNDTISGQTQFCFVDIGSGSANMKAGMLRPLATTGQKQYSLAQDIPTLAESGMPGVVVEVKTLVMAPSKTPPVILDRLNAVFQEVLGAADVQKSLISMTQEVMGGPRAGLQDELVRESASWKGLIAERHIKFGS